MTREQTFVTYENIRVQRWHKNIWTFHVIRSPMVPSFCRLELPQPSYHPIKALQVFIWNTFFALSFIMALYGKFQHARLCWVFANQVTYKMVLMTKVSRVTCMCVLVHMNYTCICVYISMYVGYAQCT